MSLAQTWSHKTGTARMDPAVVLTAPVGAATDPATSLRRLQALGATSPAARTQAEHLIRIATRGLAQMRTRDGVVQTMRLDRAAAGGTLIPEGDSLRYAAITALGVPRLSHLDQRRSLAGMSAPTLAIVAAERARHSEDIGAVALAAWAVAEAANRFDAVLFDRLSSRLASRAPLETVSCAWVLSAALAARGLGRTDDVAEAAAIRLMASQSPAGVFPHLTPSSVNIGLRRNVGCFADQIYPIQALARWSAARGDADALAAANRCAARICEAQGPAGQWWWHYHLRSGGVVEGYPVYSVHQHAMAPMALLDLWEAGGADHLAAVARGLAWLDRHPEVNEPLVSDQKSVIWRKVGRREPKKAARAIAAAASAIVSGLRVPCLDMVFPPNQIDHECRPYEFGWMLYAWMSENDTARVDATARS